MKFLLSFITALLLVFTAGAQSHRSQSFLNVRAINTGTNTWGITNLAASILSHPGMVYNPTNVNYTNLSGTYIGTSATYLGYVGTTNSFTQASLFRPVSLWSDRNGNPPVTFLPSDPINTNWNAYSAATINVEVILPYATNGPIGFVFTPIWNGSSHSRQTNDLWGFRIPGSSGNGGGKFNVSTNVPLWRWPGASGLALVAITNQNILATPAHITNSAFISELTLNGFVP